MFIPGPIGRAGGIAGAMGGLAIGREGLAVRAGLMSALAILDVIAVLAVGRELALVVEIVNALIIE